MVQKGVCQIGLVEVISSAGGEVEILGQDLFGRLVQIMMMYVVWSGVSYQMVIQASRCHPH